jgi:hypothetical protein
MLRAAPTGMFDRKKWASIITLTAIRRILEVFLFVYRPSEYP